MCKLRYKSSDNTHERALRKLVTETLSKNGLTRYAGPVWFMKAALMISIYLLAATAWTISDSIWIVFPSAIVAGMFTIFLGISIGHDAAHHSIHPHPMLNSLGLGIFNFLGANAAIWSDRHNNGHHPYPNVPGADTDIEQTALVRLESSSELKWWHRYQFLYLPILLCLYTLNWFFHRDPKDLINLLRTEKSMVIRLKKIGIFLATKTWHVTLFLIIPLMFGSLSTTTYVSAFLVMHVSASLVVAVVLLAAHVGEDQAFPIPEADGTMQHTYLEHQLLTTADFATTNQVFNWFFGGFNHHVAHHLFPEINHVHYPKITPVVRAYLQKNGLPYLEHATWTSSIGSHFALLIREGEL